LLALVVGAALGFLGRGWLASSQPKLQATPASEEAASTPLEVVPEATAVVESKDEQSEIGQLELAVRAQEYALEAERRHSEELESDLAEMAEQLAVARADVARYKQGLERAVSTLNRQGGSSARDGSNVSRARRPRVSAYSGPYVAPLGDKVRVYGKVWNSGEADALVTLRVTLMDGQRQVATKYLRSFQVPVGTERTYEVLFSKAPAERPMSAVIEIEDGR
jgi:hypothetical protein